MFKVYRGTGAAKQFVAGPFPDQATADTVAQALSDNDVGPTFQTMDNSNSGGKQTSVSSYDKPHAVVPHGIAKGARTKDNDT